MQSAGVRDQVLDILIGIQQNGGGRTENEKAAVKLESLVKHSTDDVLMNTYIRAAVSYIRGDYNAYMTQIEAYVSKYIAEYGVIDHDTAIKEYFIMFWGVNTDSDTIQPEKFTKKFHALLKRLCPDTAFEQYTKYLSVKTQNTSTLRWYLRKVLEADDKWAVAYEEMGNLYYNEDKWKEAAECYEKAAVLSDFCKNEDLYFFLGHSYAKLRNYALEESAFRLCLEYAPFYPHANNNLGYSLYKQKRYEESLFFYDREIESGADTSHPYRNKFDSLKKLGRKAEAIELVKSNPNRFKTKYYRNELTKMCGEDADISDIIIRLQDLSESNFAGTMLVADTASGIELYPHQRDAILAMDKAILKTDDYAGLLVLPTGGGKTLTAAYWLMNTLLARGNKIIWLAHRHELLNQALRSFEKLCYADVINNKPSINFRIISGQHDKPVHIKASDDIIIAGKTSLRRGFSYLLDNWLTVNNNVFLVIDEAHHAPASEYRELISAIRANTKHFKMLGLTATPFRTTVNEQGMLKKIFPDDIVYKIDLRELINRGILSEPVFKSVSTEINMLELFRDNDSEESLTRIIGDSFFDIESIGHATAAAIANNSKRNNAIVSEYVRNRELYKQTLVFALNIEMAIVLNGLFKANGIRSDFIVSDIRDAVTGITISTEENDIKLRRFKEGELDVLVNVNILTEGTDLPKTQSVFLTRPTKSTILMTQMIGRALRGEKAGGTKEAYIVSFIDDWQDKIAWVNPEQLFIDENVDFTKKDRETQQFAMRLVSIAKIEEFARIANDTIDPRLSEINFINRIPIGIYKFSYLVESGNEEEYSKSCDILVYDLMKDSFDELFAWLPTADLSDIDISATHVDSTLFNETDSLLGYNRQDIIDIIRYYKQTGEIPQMLYLSERSEYDVSALARYIIDNEMTPTAKKEYIDSAWNDGDAHWAAFFGVSNQRAFRKLIDDAIDKIQYADEHKPTEVKPISEKEKIRIQELPLFEIRRRFPELGERLRDFVFHKYTDSEGYYFSALSGFRSKNKLDFQIDHIKPMAHGGLTIPENLQLLRRNENKVKSDKMS